MRSFLSRGKFAWCLAPGGASGVRSRPAPARRILGGAKCRWPDACQGRSRQVGRYFRRFRRWRIVSASFSCGDRPVTSRTPPASTAQTECASGYGSPWRSAQCAGRRHGLAALQVWATTACIVPIALATPSRVLSASPRALMTAEATVNSCPSGSWAATNSRS
jgi:hypothetical protein